MNPSDRLFQFLMSQLTDEEIGLILQNPDNLAIVVAGRVIHEIDKNAKKGKHAIHRIRHKGQEILGRTDRTRGTKTVFFDFRSKREKSGRD